MATAIQTRYKGYNFRSRLEARWAVFFDAQGLKWEYEPEGYDLGAAGYYLPDFLVRSRNGGSFYAEVKPHGDADISKPLAFAKVIKAHVVLCQGMPETEALLLYVDGDHCPAAINDDWKYGPLYVCPGGESWLQPKLLAAMAAARSARFEHGQSGAPT